MSLREDFENDLLDLLDDDLLGRELLIDGSPVSCIFQEDVRASAVPVLPGVCSLQYRLIVKKADCHPVIGQELDIDDARWTVKNVDAPGLIADIRLERYVG